MNLTGNNVIMMMDSSVMYARVEHFTKSMIHQQFEIIQHKPQRGKDCGGFLLFLKWKFFPVRFFTIRTVGKGGMVFPRSFRNPCLYLLFLYIFFFVYSIL